jgi:hypothetical protein
MNESGIALEEKTKEERFEKYETLLSSQLENDKTLHLIMKKLHEQKISWKLHGRNSPRWAFDCVNDGSKVDVNVSQLMRYVIRYNNLISFIVLKKRIRLKKAFGSYLKNNGIYGIYGLYCIVVFKQNISCSTIGST